MLINDRVERGAKSPSQCHDAVCSVVTETANQQRGEGGEENKNCRKDFLAFERSVVEWRSNQNPKL